MNQIYVLAYLTGFAFAISGAYLLGGFPAAFTAAGAGMMLGVILDRLGDISRKIGENSEPSP